MNGAQALSFGIIAAAMVCFAWGRFRYDLIALAALGVGLATSDVPAKEAFSGFTSDVVVIIASALVVSAAIARSGFIEGLVGPLLPRLKTPATQVPAMAGATAVLSMLTKNVGALAILMPTALRLGRNEKSSASSLLMPMSFLSLLGGLVTLVGTSTNIIVTQVREETLGKPFGMFDFAPVGLVLTALGLLFVSFGWRLLPRDRKGRTSLGEATAATAYSTEATLPEEWPEELQHIRDLKLEDDKVAAVGLIGTDGRHRKALSNTRLSPGQTLLLEGDDAALARVFGRLPLKPTRADAPIDKADAREEIRSVEAVVQSHSTLIGHTAERMDLQQRYGVKLIAVGRANERITERLRDVTLRAGDMLVLQAGEKALPEIVEALGLLPLAERVVQIGDRRRRYGPILVLTAAIALVAWKGVPIAAAFFGAAVMMVVIGALSMREAYGALEPEVLVLIGALTPLSEAIRHTGGTDLVAQGLANLSAGSAPMLILGALLVTAMACSPFLHNAPTVLVLGPIALGLAQQLHLNPDPFLMAVAVGSGCDFLTPIGHQCNLLVMGPGGYRFGDYWRLGLPLSLLVIVVGTPLIAWVWPIVPH